MVPSTWVDKCVVPQSPLTNKGKEVNPPPHTKTKITQFGPPMKNAFLHVINSANLVCSLSSEAYKRNRRWYCHDNAGSLEMVMTFTSVDFINQVPNNICSPASAVKGFVGDKLCKICGQGPHLAILMKTFFKSTPKPWFFFPKQNCIFWGGADIFNRTGYLLNLQIHGSRPLLRSWPTQNYSKTRTD